MHQTKHTFAMDTIYRARKWLCSYTLKRNDLEDYIFLKSNKLSCFANNLGSFQGQYLIHDLWKKYLDVHVFSSNFSFFQLWNYVHLILWFLGDINHSGLFKNDVTMNISNFRPPPPPMSSFVIFSIYPSLQSHQANNDKLFPWSKTLKNNFTYFV